MPSTKCYSRAQTNLKQDLYWPCISQGMLKQKYMTDFKMFTCSTSETSGWVIAQVELSCVALYAQTFLITSKLGLAT